MADLPKPLPASQWQHDMWTADQLDAYAAAKVAEAVAPERARADKAEASLLRIADACRESPYRRFFGFDDALADLIHHETRLMTKRPDAIRGTEAASRGE